VDSVFHFVSEVLLLPCSNGIRLVEAIEDGGHNKLPEIHGGGGRSGFYEARAVRSNALDAACHLIISPI
jgi:hypothetical protein